MDRRYDPDHYLYDLTYTQSADGGSTWTTNRRVSDFSSNANAVPDYKSLIQEKLRTSGDLYRFLIDEFHQSRTFWLEFLVVLILLIELVYVFHGKM